MRQPIVFLIAFLLAAPASAAECLPETVIKLNPAELEAVTKALGSRPVNITADTLIKIQWQPEDKGSGWSVKSVRIGDGDAKPCGRGVKP